jgi:hypothetical protein
MFLAVDHIAVAAEGEAEEIAAQGHEHRHGVGVLLTLPRADVVGLHGPRGVAVERDGSHVPAEVRDGQLDLRRGDNPARLGGDGAGFLTGAGKSGDGEDEGEEGDVFHRE